MATALGWIGNCFLVIGLWKIGDKWRNAFLFTIVGETAWAAKSVMVQDWALATICLVFNVMAGINWYKWGKNEL